MHDVSISLHITGPDWIWYVLCAAAAFFAISYAVNVGVRLWAERMSYKLAKRNAR